MLALWSLVDTGVKLETDLVFSACDVESEPAKLAQGRALVEAQGEAQVQQIGRPWIEPIRSESRRNGDVAHGGSEKIGEGLRAPVLAIDHQSNDVEILGGTFEQLGKEQAAAADDGEFGVLALIGQNLAEGFQRFFEGPRREHSSTLISRVEKIKCSVGENKALDLQAQWRQTIDVNLMGAANVIYWAIHHMKRGGRIVNVSSRGAFRGEPRQPAYGASKAGLNALGQSLAVALAPLGIAVATVAPGFVEADPSNAHVKAPRGPEIGQVLPLLRRPGRLLVGDTYWRRRPSGELLAFLGATRASLPSLDDHEAALVQSGFVVERALLATDSDWDR